MPASSWVLLVWGALGFAVGMVKWSDYRQDWRDAFWLGVAAGGLVLLVAGVALAPGWS